MLNYTHRKSHEFQTTATSTPSDLVGEVGYNDDKYKLRLLYIWDKLTFSIDTTHYSSALDDATQDKNDYTFNAVDSMTYVDLQGRYQFNDQIEVYLGIDNLLGEDPPFCPNCKNEPGPGSHYTGLQNRIWDSTYWYAGLKFTM